MSSRVAASVGGSVVSGMTMFMVGKNWKQQDVTKQDVAKENVNKQSVKMPIQPIIRNIKLNPHCDIIYSTLHKAPLAVHEKLTKDIIKKVFRRNNNFRPDENIKPQKFAVDQHYYKDIPRLLNKNRGHMAASSNYASNHEWMDSTFKHSNIIPQNMDNNGLTWRTFEEYCLRLLNEETCDSLEIVSGPVFDSQIKNPQYPNDSNIYLKTQTVIKENGIIIPRHLYKIIKCNTKQGNSYGSAYIFKNYQADENKTSDFRKLRLLDFQIDFEKLQTRTGLIFNLKDNLKGNLSSLKPSDQNKTIQDHRSQDFIQAMENIGQYDLQTICQKGQVCTESDIASYLDKIDKKAKEQMEKIRSKTKIGECDKLLKDLYLMKAYSSLMNKFPSVQGSMKNQFSAEIKERIPYCMEEKAAQNDQKKQVKNKQILAQKQKIRDLLTEDDAKIYPKELFRAFSIL